MLEHGGDIKGYVDEFGSEPLDYSANISPLGLPEKVRQAVINALDECVDYPDPLCRDLVAAIAEFERVPEEWILCGNGCSDLLFRLAGAVKPRRVLLTAPAFSEYEQAFATAQAEFVYCPLSADNGFALADDFLTYIQQGIDVVTLCQPNNPTGVTVSRDMLLAVLERCEQVGALLVVDECFLEFLDDAASLTLVPWLAEHPQLVVLKAFTKIYGIPGIRLGYALCSDGERIEALRAAGQPWAVSNLAQSAGIAALTCTDYVAQTRALVQEQRAFLRDELLKRGIETTGEANFLFFYFGAFDLVAAMRKQGVLIRDCSNYEGLGAGWCRIAVRSAHENEGFLVALDNALASMD